MSKRYEYLILDAPEPVRELKPWLDDLGNKGWHLSAIDSSWNPRRYVFARLLKAEADR